MSAIREQFAVVGSSGFIGRALLDRLRSDGTPVVAISRQAAAADVGIASYLDQAEIAAAIGERCGVVIHLAALAHRRGESVAAFEQVNVEMALSVARAAIMCRVRRFVFVSSIGVIGNETTGIPFDEATPPAPVADYARSKLRAEQALTALLGPTDVQLTIIRPPLVHGPGAPGNFGKLATLARGPWPLPLGSLGANRRSLVGIDNLVDFLIVAARHEAATGRTLLVTDDEDISTASLARTLVALARLHGQGRGRVVSVPPFLLEWVARRAGRRDMARQLIGSLQIDASASMALLGWSPPISLATGLARAMEIRR